MIRILCSFHWKRFLWKRMILILLGGFLVKTLLRFYILFELSLIPILIMIIYWGSQPERLSASLYFLIYTTFISIPYIIIVLLSTPSLFFIIKAFSVSHFSLILLIRPFLVKIPVIGLHYWLPKAHVEASTRGSILLAGILLKLGRYGVFRVAKLSLLLISKAISSWLVLRIIAALVTMIQNDIKKLIAYRRVSHMTIIIVRIFSSTKVNLFCILIISLAHGWASIGIFAIAGMLRRSATSRIIHLLGKETKLYWILVILGLLLLSNRSIPPLPSFFSELFLVRSLSNSSLLVIVFILFRFSVCYYNRFLFLRVSFIKPQEHLKRISFIKNMNIRVYFRVMSLLTLIWLRLISSLIWCSDITLLFIKL